MDLSKIEKAYSGKAETCCCGCAGTHYEATGGANDTKQIARIAGIVESALLTGNADEIDNDTTYTAVVIGKRIYVVYWTAEECDAIVANLLRETFSGLALVGGAS